eukprot:gene8504-biopygen8623
MEKSDLQGQHLRWLGYCISLQEFDFTVQYRPGPKNEKADVPSRYVRGFADVICLALAREPPRGVEINPEAQVANYCERLVREQLGTGEVHRLFDLHYQEELECNRSVMFDTDHPEVARMVFWQADTCRLGRPGPSASSSQEDRHETDRQELREGVICYEPCGGLCAGLEIVLLRCGVKVNKYIYQDTSPASQAVARARCLALSRLHSDLFPAAAIHLEQLPSNLEDTMLKDLVVVHAGASAGCARGIIRTSPASILEQPVPEPPVQPGDGEGGQASHRTDTEGHPAAQGWKPRRVVSGDRKPHHIANVVGEPMRVLPTILATQNAPGLSVLHEQDGTVLVKVDDTTEEGESREVNLDEKAIAMGYSASELRMTVAEASTTRLSRSEESQEVTRSSDYTRQVAQRLSHQDWEQRLQQMCSQGQKGTQGLGTANAVQRRRQWKLAPMEEAFRERYPDIHEDELCREWLKTGGAMKLPKEDYQRVRKRAARHRWDELTGELHMVTINGKELLVPKPGDRLGLVRDCHGRTSHWGISRTLNLLWQRHYWEEAMLTPLEIKSFMYRWSLDLAWPTKRMTKDGNQRVLIMTEHYTRFIVCVPIPNKEASAIAKFKGAFANLCSQCLIDRRVTSPDSPEGNGLTERVVRTIKFCFKKMALDKGLDYEWDELLWSLVLSYNAAKQQSTGVAPFTLLFAQEATVPPDLRNQPELNFEDQEEKTLAEDLLQRANIVKKLTVHAGCSLEIAQHRDTLLYEYSRSGGFEPKPHQFKVGDFVYIRQKPRSGMEVATKPAILKLVKVQRDGVVVLEDSAKLREKSTV